MSLATIKRKNAERRASEVEATENAAKSAKGAELAGKCSNGDDVGAADEIGAMNMEVDFLSQIRADTGEQGQERDGYIMFEHCPICHHRDCFRFYPSTNSCCCFSDSTTMNGGKFTQYMHQVHGLDEVEQVRVLRERTGHPYVPPKESAQGEGRADVGRWLIKRANLHDMPTLAPCVWEGRLRLGRKGIIAGASKSAKSWLAIDFAESVAAGADFLGQPCRRGRVLYANFELASDYFPRRLRKVAEARGFDFANVERNLDHIDLRGFYEGTDAFKRLLFSQARRGEYDLIVIDPLYKLFGGDENSAQEVAVFCKMVDEVCEQLGCALVYVHHFSKGAKGDVASIDRASGSGVFARDPDLIATVTELHPPSDGEQLEGGARAFELALTLREFPPCEPFHTVFRHPLHVLDADGITSDWKPRSSQREGGKSTAALNKLKARSNAFEACDKLAAYFIRNRVGAEGLLMSEALEVAGVPRKATLEAYLDQCGAFEVWRKSERKVYVVPAQPPTCDGLEL